MGKVFAFGTGAIVFSTVSRLVDIAKLAVLSFGGTAEAVLGKAGIAAVNVGRALKIAGGVIASFMVGWDIGTWLRQFDVVEKAGIAMAAGLTKAWIRAKLAWARLTNSDTSALVKELENAG